MISRAGNGPGRRRLNPLSVSPAFKAFVLDQLGELGDVTPRSMFGGVGLYRRGLFFGIIAGDVLYLKVDADNRRDYERAGMRPFKPYRDRPGTMQYYSVPVDILESALDLGAPGRRRRRAKGAPAAHVVRAREGEAAQVATRDIVTSEATRTRAEAVGNFCNRAGATTLHFLQRLRRNA